MGIREANLPRYKKRNQERQEIRDPAAKCIRDRSPSEPEFRRKNNPQDRGAHNILPLSRNHLRKKRAMPAASERNKSQARYDTIRDGHLNARRGCSCQEIRAQNDWLWFTKYAAMTGLFHTMR